MATKGVTVTESKNKFLFSIIVVALNESKSIARMAATCKNFIDEGGEVILMDTGSTDGTVEIAKSLGIVVHEVGAKFVTILTKSQAKKLNSRFVVPGEGEIAKEGQRIFNFSKARNHADTYSSNDMIIQVDSSDVFNHFDYNKLNQEIKDNSTLFEYQLSLGNTPFKIKRFYNRKLKEWHGCIHEHIKNKQGKSDQDSKMFTCDIETISLTHIKNQVKARNYSAGMALDIIKESNNSRWYHYLGRELYYDSKWKSALKVLIEGTDLENAYGPERNQTACYAAECYMKLNDKKNAIDMYLKAFNIYPNRRQPLIKLAEIYINDEKYQQALCYAKASLEILAPGNGFAENSDNYGYLPYELIYRSLAHLKRFAESKYYWKKAQSVAKHRNFSSDKHLFGDIPDFDIDVPFPKEPIYQFVTEEEKKQIDLEEKLFGSVIRPEEKNVIVGSSGSVQIEEKKVDIILVEEKQVENVSNSKKTVVLLEERKSTNKQIILFNPGSMSYVFSDMVKTLYQSLKSANINVIIKKFLSKEELLATKSNGNIYILYNAHSNLYPFNWKLDYIIYNWEQASYYSSKNPTFRELVKSGKAVIDYSLANSDIINFESSKKFVLSFGYHDILKYNRPEKKEKKTAALFFGFPNDRRIEITDHIIKKGIKLKYIKDYSCFDDKLVDECMDTDIVLNIHHYLSPSILELSRIIPLLSNGKIVISERSDDKYTDNMLKDFVILCDGAEEMYQKCKFFLESEEARKKHIDNLLTNFPKVWNNDDLLKSSGLLEMLQ